MSGVLLFAAWVILMTAVFLYQERAQRKLIRSYAELLWLREIRAAGEDVTNG